MRKLWLCAGLLGCAGDKPAESTDAGDTTPADTDFAVDTDQPETVETADLIDTVDSAPEATCTDAPAEIWCGIGGPGAPFTLLNSGQDVVLEMGAQHLTHFYSAAQLRNTEQAVRLWRRVTDVNTGDVLHETRVLNNLAPLAGGTWDCEGYLSGVVTPLTFGDLEDRDLQVSLCGREVLFEMASEEAHSPADAPVVLASGSVRVVLRPDPLVDPTVSCD